MLRDIKTPKENKKENTKENAHAMIAVMPHARAFLGVSLCFKGQYINPNKGIKAAKIQSPTLTLSSQICDSVVGLTTAQPQFGQTIASSKISFPHLEQNFMKKPPFKNISKWDICIIPKWNNNVKVFS